MNWREKVNNEDLYVNKGWFEARGQTAPDSVEGLRDCQLLIKLSGIKRLAEERGYTSVDINVSHPYSDYVVAKCSIFWRMKINHEERFSSFSYSECANATKANTNGFGKKFLEAIACNRAFIRCVRSSLGIHIVGIDEIDASEPEEIPNKNTPQKKLEDAAIKSGISSFEEFQKYAKEGQEGLVEGLVLEAISKWKSYDDVPPKDCRAYIKLLK